MNIILLQGDHTEKSYERLSQFIDSAKKRGWQVKRLDGKKVNNVSDEFSTQSLFGEESLYVLTNFAGLKDKDNKWLKESSKDVDGTLVIYETGKLHAGTAKSLPINKTENFELDKVVWKFLDSIRKGNAEISLTLYRQTVESEAPEFVFALIVGLIQDLYQAKVAPESLKYPSWRTGKLKSQVKDFTEDDLVGIINKLAEMDLKSKTGKANVNSEIELLIATSLN